MCLFVVSLSLLLAVAMALGNLERCLKPPVIDNLRVFAEVPVFHLRYETLILTWHTQLYFS
jgi:hypothetical protein